MKKIEFSYYDWNEFKNFLDRLSDKDAAQLICNYLKYRNIWSHYFRAATGNNGLKKLESNLYEILSQRSSNIQRALYWTQYVITNAFTKKSRKTPESKKKIARNRRDQLFRQKEEHNE